MQSENYEVNKLVFFILSKGLTPAESGRLSSYFHFREPIFLQEKTLLQKVCLIKIITVKDTFIVVSQSIYSSIYFSTEKLCNKRNFSVIMLFFDSMLVQF